MSTKHIEVWRSNPSDGSCSHCHRPSDLTIRLGSMATQTIRFCLGCLINILNAPAVLKALDEKPKPVPSRVAVPERPKLHTGDVDLAGLARFILDDWLRHHTGADFDRVIDEMKVGQYRHMFDELESILRVGGKPP